MLYDKIGIGYNHTRCADPYIASRILDGLAAAPGSTLLDIGCGTGNYTIALADQGYHLCGVDPSEEMLGMARSRSQAIQWLHGTAESIPVEDQRFDGLFGTLTLHHWTSHERAFAELYRVLKSGAHAVFLSYTPEQVRGYWLNHYFPQMLEKAALSIPPYDAIIATASRAGFEVLPPEKYFVQADLQDHFMYVGKHNPELYFDETVRRGISAFAVLSDKEEVAHGLARLRADMDSGAFADIRQQYENEDGDYLFMRLQKA